MAQRLKTGKESIIWLIKLAYMLLALPFLLFIGIAMLFITGSGKSMWQGSGAIAYASIIWAAILIPVGVFIYGVLSRRRLLKKITAALRDSAYFNPDEICEMYHEGDGKYLGIDTKNGTILYVHKIRKGQVDVVPLTMEDWTNREVEGKSMFRLYTKLPDLPRIEIVTPWAQRWYDTLGAMEHKQYNTPQPFGLFVRDRLDALEREHNVQIQRLA